MLLDGAFLIELFKESGRGYTQIPYETVKSMKKDFLMLQNQIPYSVLQGIFEIQEGESARTTLDLHVICLQFFDICNPYKKVCNLKENPKHILHLYYIAFTKPQPSSSYDCTSMLLKSQNITIPSATQLRDHGIKLERTSQRDHSTYVQFLNDTLGLPFLDLNHIKRCALANMVVYEEINQGTNKPIASLCCFYNCLLRTEEDVAYLSKKEIIANRIGNHKDVIELFSGICFDLDIDQSSNYLSEASLDINRSYQSKLKGWFGRFRRQFCGWPIAVAVSFVAFLNALGSISLVISHIEKYFE
ncbi:hypothetical protein LUZ62_015075 [Rhynchospora pubera]|uniref:Uncharacterized protein n=1 Tax=Rhynchospora pubera TaxID=906938 RepID=A0AAV8GE70_9POAL|nr:hypothetical protein LUZ62_015075 [Rhynchospora pubera]